MADDNAVLSAEWLAEGARRSADLDAGVVITVAWETVRENTLRRAGLSDADGASYQGADGDR